MSAVKGNKEIAIGGNQKSYWTGTSEKRADITTKGIWVAYFRPKSKSILRKSTQAFRPKSSVHFSKGASRSVRMQKGEGPSQGVIEQSEPHERSLFSLKFEDRSQEDSLQRERCARRDAWDRAQNGQKFKEKETAIFIGRQKFGHHQLHLR